MRQRSGKNDHQALYRFSLNRLLTQSSVPEASRLQDHANNHLISEVPRSADNSLAWKTHHVQLGSIALLPSTIDWPLQILHFCSSAPALAIRNQTDILQNLTSIGQHALAEAPISIVGMAAEKAEKGIPTQFSICQTSD